MQLCNITDRQIHQPVQTITKFNRAYVAEMADDSHTNLAFDTIGDWLAGGWDKWATDLVNPDFAAYAKSCGGLGIKAIEKEDMEEAFTKLFEHKGPALLEIISDVNLV